MKRIELFSLLSAINDFSVAKRVTGTNFSLAVIKNRELLQKELVKYQKDIEKFNLDETEAKYESERIQICIDLSDKDADGQPLINTDFWGRGMFVMTKDAELECEKRLNALAEKYGAEIVALVQEKKKNIDLSILEDVDLELCKIDTQDLPKDLTEEEVSSILSMIK